MGVHYKTTVEQRQEIVRRYIAGEDTQRIARDYKITPQLVGHYARCVGIPYRRRRRPCAPTKNQ
jgi:hypothetical protein